MNNTQAIFVPLVWPCHNLFIRNHFVTPGLSGKIGSRNNCRTANEDPEYCHTISSSLLSHSCQLCGSAAPYQVNVVFVHDPHRKA